MEPGSETGHQNPGPEQWAGKGNDTCPRSLKRKSGVKAEPRVRDVVKVKDGARDGVKKREGFGMGLG